MNPLSGERSAIEASAEVKSACRASIGVLALALAALFVSPARAETSPSDDCAGSGRSALLAKGCAALDDFMKAFNAKDAAAWAATLNYPHVRLAGGEVLVWQTAADYAAANDVGALGRTGWARSAWDYRHLVQAGDDKLHFAVQFTRYGADGTKLGSYPSLYVVTLRNGHWGVQARSSYAGIVHEGSAF